MQRFTPHTFTIGDLDGISSKTIEEHIKLYQGYVKHANLILDHIDELSQDSEKYAYELAELQRRFGFEFDGMRNHEYYFHAFEGGAQTLAPESPLRKKIEKDFGSFDAWVTRFRAIAMTRGIGWAILAHDTETGRLFNVWIGEHDGGHLAGAKPLLIMDVFEHAFMLDYGTKRADYIEAFMKAVDWKVCETRIK